MPDDHSSPATPISPNSRTPWRSDTSPPPKSGGFKTGTGQPIYSFFDCGRVARDTMPPPPDEWPCTTWKGVGFCVPNFPDCPGVGSAEINWGCKNGTVAVVKALDSGDWSSIQNPATAIMLAIFDKVLMLYVLSIAD